MVEKGKVVRKIRMDEWACERVNERERERERDLGNAIFPT